MGDLGESNTAIYRKLKPGTYTLHIKSKDVSGTVTETDNTVVITVKPPLWVRWWAIIIYIALLAVIFFFVYKHLKEVYRLRRDIDVEHKLTEYKLKFFTNISHEFRTPLTLIEVAIDKIQDAKEIPSGMRQPINNMQRSVERMLRLINQLLEFRRMQNNKLSLSLQKTDVVSFLRDIYMSFHDIAESRNINYVFTTSDKVIETYIDRGHVDKIVYNLLSNAFKYTPRGGKIELGIRKEVQQGTPSMLKIAVSDTGIGVAKDKQGELFNRFATGNVSPDSIGIGLNLTKELVRVHQGSINYRGNIPNGSIFTVLLPLDKAVYKPDDFLKTNTAIELEDQGNTPSQPNDYKELMPEPMNDKTVLVVEDNMDVAEMLRRELSRYFSIIHAVDGKEALGLLHDKNYMIDMVVSDILMPNMDGFELTKAIRADKRLRQLPVILLTALDSEAKQEQGMNVGADAYVTKPFNLRLLIAQCCKRQCSRRNTA